MNSVNNLNIKLNKIDIRYIMSNHFDINQIKDNEKIKYGFKKIAIANFIIGILKSNEQKALKKQRNGKSCDHVFFDKLANKYIVLNRNQSIISYKTIAKRIGCSLEMVRLVVVELISLGVLVHRKIRDSVFWLFEFININKVFDFFMHCRMTFDSFHQKNKKFIYCDQDWEFHQYDNYEVHWDDE